jgi:hypothetical protein
MFEIGILLNLLHYFFNRFIVVPVGFIIGFGWYGAFIVAFAVDMCQMFAYFYFLEGAGVNRKVGHIITKWFPSQNKVEQTRTVIKLRRMGYVGIMILAALPVYFGGMYSAVLVSHLMHLKRKKSYVFLTIGSVIGSAIITLGFKAAWELFV